MQTPGVFDRLKPALLNASILTRVLIGNSLVIVIGAIGGTLLTRQLTLMGDVDLILIFATLGIVASLLINYAIIRTALRPLQELRRMVDQVEARSPRLTADLVREVDPDIRRLMVAVKDMISRLERRNRQMRALSERAINAREEERKRIARGLHDDTAQALTMLIINLERIQSGFPGAMEAQKEQLAGARRLATVTLEDLRKIVFDLRPTMLDDLGLVPAIRWYARFSLQEAGIEVSFDVPEDATRLRPHLETLLFRVTQEAVNNIVRHAEAKNVAIYLRKGNSGILLEIRDDGCGFDVAETTGQAVMRQRLGLLGMEERVALVNGSVRIESGPGEGTAVRVRVPIFQGHDMETGSDG